MVNDIVRCCFNNCGQAVGKSLQSISNHLMGVHHIRTDCPIMSKCVWAGCHISVPSDGLAKHIMNAHMRA